MFAHIAGDCYSKCVFCVATVAYSNFQIVILCYCLSPLSSHASRLLGLGPAGSIAEEACRLGGWRRLLMVGWLYEMDDWLGLGLVLRG